ncbi:MAG TPA: protein phosphatase 2C domain-containing protein [Blastocatellia bacterium]|nr:protein phosphatase 2C domain-containing protein [Blastocatellia bacterium]
MDAIESFRLPSPKGEVPSARVEVDIGALSHQGKVRRNNEDHFLVLQFDRTMRSLLTNLPPGRVPDRYQETGYGMVVADGMGGAAAGEVASQLAIGSLIDLVLRTPDWIMRFDELRAREVLLRIDQRFQQVSQMVLERAEANPLLAGMGTTMTAACSLGKDMVIAHVGDSRVYLFRNGRLHRLTRDHTMAQALADAGVIGQDAVDTHPMRHVLTQAIGTKDTKTEAELGMVELVDGDQVLLCTDGLTEAASADGIIETLRTPGHSADVCRGLVDQALAGGGPDNVTVVLARYRMPHA